MKKEIRLAGRGESSYRSEKAAELRVAEDEGGPKLTGYAAVFNVWSVDLGGFKERIRPGAFRKTISEADVLAVIDHNSCLILGRTSSTGNPLKLEEDEVGLRYSVPLTDGVSYVRDLMSNVRAANIQGNSFAFSAVSDMWGTDDGMDWRELIEVKLYDVGPVSSPAYPQTSLGLRAYIGVEDELAQLRGVLFRMEHGRKLRDPDLELLNHWVGRLQSCLPAEEPGPAPHSERSDTGPFIFDIKGDSTGTATYTLSTPRPEDSNPVTIRIGTPEARFDDVDKLIEPIITDLRIGGNKV